MPLGAGGVTGEGCRRGLRLTEIPTSEPVFAPVWAAGVLLGGRRDSVSRCLQYTNEG
jgi:hypothetical protein